jgi:hypothetical protein
MRSIRQHTSAYITRRARRCRSRPHTSAYVRIRPHTSAYVSYVSIRQLTSLASDAPRSPVPQPSPSVSIRQHTSAYVSIRQHTSAYDQHTSAYVSIRQHTSAYDTCIRCAALVRAAAIPIRQDTSGYVSIRYLHQTRRARPCRSHPQARPRL